MPSREDLPFLLALLDDDAPEVRRQIAAALSAFGDDLPILIQPYWGQLNSTQIQCLTELCNEAGVEPLAGSWLAWLGQDGFHEALEQAMIHLSQVVYGPPAEYLSFWLDRLAQRFRQFSPERHSTALMQFLFEEQGFTCIPEPRYTHEQDLLFHVLAKNSGSPTALTCLAILVGRRVGIDLHGVFIRGHFVSMTYETQMQMFNANDLGKPHSRSSAIFLEEALRRNCTWLREMRAPVFEIVNRILQQVIRSLSEQPQCEPLRQYQRFQQELSLELKRRGLVE